MKPSLLNGWRHSFLPVLLTKWWWLLVLFSARTPNNCRNGWHTCDDVFLYARTAQVTATRGIFNDCVRIIDDDKTACRQIGLVEAYGRWLSWSQRLIDRSYTYYVNIRRETWRRCPAFLLFASLATQLLWLYRLRDTHEDLSQVNTVPCAAAPGKLPITTSRSVIDDSIFRWRFSSTFFLAAV